MKISEEGSTVTPAGVTLRLSFIEDKANDGEEKIYQSCVRIRNARIGTIMADFSEFEKVVVILIAFVLSLPVGTACSAKTV